VREKAAGARRASAGVAAGKRRRTGSAFGSELAGAGEAAQPHPECAASAVKAPGREGVSQAQTSFFTQQSDGDAPWRIEQDAKLRDGVAMSQKAANRTRRRCRFRR
jgi:hypothetical protein